MEKNKLAAFIIGLIVFALMLFFISDSVVCTDVSKEVCFNSVLFEPFTLIISFISGLIVFFVFYFLISKFSS